MSWGLGFLRPRSAGLERCSYCGSYGHPSTHCPKTAGGQGQLAALRCGYCGGRDHNTAACPKLGPRPRKGGIRVVRS